MEITLKNNQPASLRRAKWHELWRLVRIQKKAFGMVTMPLIQKIYEHIFQVVHFRIVEQDNTILGYVGIQQSKKTQSRINVIAVNPEAQSLGVGQHLMQSVVDCPISKHTTHIVLNVRQSNATAIHVYQKLGYTIQHEQKRYYSRPREDGYFMKKEIKH